MKEGRLEDLISIEDQTEIIVKNASDSTLAKIRSIIEENESTDFVRMGKPRTTLERLFLEEARISDESATKGEQDA